MAVEIPTESGVEQKQIENACIALYASYWARETKGATDDTTRDGIPSTDDFSADELVARVRPCIFLAERHEDFLISVLKKSPLPRSYLKLECSRPWLIYWSLQPLALLGRMEAFLDAGNRQPLIDLLKACQHPEGGFGGGAGQLGHLATTYAALSSLALLRSLDVVDKDKLKAFLFQMKQPRGRGFTMQNDGEIDIRGVYCAVASAAIAGVLSEELCEGVPEYVKECQRYDGGIAGVIAGEAHAGYTYCGLAALCIMGKAEQYLDIPRLIRWTVHRQMEIEGGFTGRPNKVVDSCYTFWVSAALSLSQSLLHIEQYRLVTAGRLAAYVLVCCQPALQSWDPSAQKVVVPDSHAGGLCDKPGQRPDTYHTCYALSGLSILQHRFMTADEAPLFPDLRETCPLLNIEKNLAPTVW